MPQLGSNVIGLNTTKADNPGLLWVYGIGDFVVNLQGYFKRFTHYIEMPSLEYGSKLLFLWMIQNMQKNERL